MRGDVQAGGHRWPLPRRRGPAPVLAAVVLLFLAPACKVLQYNLGAGAGRNGAPDVIAFVAQQRPLLVTLNEVCGRRFHDIRDAIAGYGYQGTFAATNPGGCGGSNAGLGYGNAVFHLGARIGAPAIASFAAQDPQTLAESGERRGIACVRFDAYGTGSFLGCVTHIDHHAGYYQQQQALEALSFVSYIRALAGHPPTIVGGDFNLTRSQYPMNRWYDTFTEVDPANHATHGSRKIDYVFFDAGLRRVGAAQVLSGASDHRMLAGDLVWW